MKRFLQYIFTWWNGDTAGTRFYTWRKGIAVGEDEQGNRYYRNKDSSRRWVIYNGIAEASRIPPGWHGWIHFRTAEPPAAYTPREWQKPHMANPTGTAMAYRPPGSILHGRPATPARPDYEPWSPSGR